MLEPYRHLAAAVLARVVEDAQGRGPCREEARAWLTRSEYRRVRETWCEAAGVSPRTVRRVALSGQRVKVPQVPR